MKNEVILKRQSIIFHGLIRPDLSGSRTAHFTVCLAVRDTIRTDVRGIGFFFFFFFFFLGLV